MTQAKAKNPHYYKDVKHLDHIDVYRVLHLFGVTDPCLQHAIKKLLVSGGRGGGKDQSRDINEAILSLQRWQEMREEEKEPISVNLDRPDGPGDAGTAKTCRRLE